MLGGGPEPSRHGRAAARPRLRCRGAPLRGALSIGERTARRPSRSRCASHSARGRGPCSGARSARGAYASAAPRSTGGVRHLGWERCSASISSKGVAEPLGPNQTGARLQSGPQGQWHALALWRQRAGEERWTGRTSPASSSSRRKRGPACPLQCASASCGSRRRGASRCHPPLLSPRRIFNHGRQQKIRN